MPPPIHTIQRRVVCVRQGRRTRARSTRLERSEKTLNLSRARREFDIANVLENILAEQDLTRSRADYINVIAEFNKAQYELLKALGRLSAPTLPSDHGRSH